MVRMSRRGEQRWEAALDEHRVALAAFIDSAERVPEGEWTQRRSDGKWTPGEVAEHLVLVNQALIADLVEGHPMASRVSGWKQLLLRRLLLPHILFHRTFPRGARAPRETRPSGGGADRAVELERLRESAERLEAEMERARRSDPPRQISHPYFGTVLPTPALRFCAVHLEHHRRQLER